MQPRERRSTNEAICRQILESVVQPTVIHDLTSLVAQRRRWSILLRVRDSISQLLVFPSLIASFVSGSIYAHSTNTPMVGEYLPFLSGILNVVSIFLMRFTGFAQQQYNRLDQCIGEALAKYNISIELPGSAAGSAKDKVAGNSNSNLNSNQNPIVSKQINTTQKIVERFAQRPLPPDRTLGTATPTLPGSPQ